MCDEKGTRCFIVIHTLDFWDFTLKMRRTKSDLDLFHVFEVINVNITKEFY